jgi:outer membrane lipoprotein SlyB
MIWKSMGIIIGLCILRLPARAQTYQWQDVEKLVPGTPVSVVKRTRQGCELVKATDSELTCLKDIGRVTRTLVFARDQVREVRLEIPAHNKIIVGAIAGAVVGGLLGILGGQTSDDPEARGYARAFGIPVGAFVGGAIGKHIHRHGAVIYRK